MQAGILIIGSLLWDNCNRKIWRQSRLDEAHGIPVGVSICYGRRSTSRGNTFTMTLGCGEARGKAVLMPCVSAIESVADLVIEAKELWKAELSKAKPDSISAEWGTVGAIFNPTVQAGWQAGWGDYFCSHGKAVPPVDKAGILQIPWPVALDGSANDLDMVLAIATKAEPTLPTPTEIADAWINQDCGHERYFFENVQHDIRTPDDHLIWQRIECMDPPWLNQGAYNKAISNLRSTCIGRV